MSRLLARSRRQSPDPAAGAAEQPLVLVAVLQILRVEVHGLTGADGERYRLVPPTRVVRGPYDHPAAPRKMIDDAHEALVIRARGGGEQGDHLA